MNNGDLKLLLDRLSQVETVDPADNQVLFAAYATLGALADRVTKLKTIADAAKNLVAQKGRHNTEIAYRRLEEAVKKWE